VILYAGVPELPFKDFFAQLATLSRRKETFDTLHRISNTLFWDGQQCCFCNFAPKEENCAWWPYEAIDSNSGNPFHIYRSTDPASSSRARPWYAEAGEEGSVPKLGALEALLVPLHSREKRRLERYQWRTRVNARSAVESSVPTLLWFHQIEAHESWTCAQPVRVVLEEASMIKTLWKSICQFAHLQALRREAIAVLPTYSVNGLSGYIWIVRSQ
jgi:hypothetical protein